MPKQVRWDSAWASAFKNPTRISKTSYFPIGSVMGFSKMIMGKIVLDKKCEFSTESSSQQERPFNHRTNDRLSAKHSLDQLEQPL